MSKVHHPDAVKAPELQVWNNAAFDNGELDDSIEFKPSSWWSRSLESNCSKENLSPIFEKSPVSLKSSVSSAPTKPLHSNTIVVNTGNQLKPVSKQGMVSKNMIQEEGNCDERRIDMEIEEIEKEIRRLSSRLEALQLEKAERSLKSVEKRGRIVQAKFMEQKQSAKNEKPLLSSAKAKISRRGVSLGPVEIFSAAKSGFLSKKDITPVSTQSRRKSCFWKLEEIDELKVIKERGKSLSVSPRSQKTASKIQSLKQAATTVGFKRPSKKEDTILASIQPKALFKDGEKSEPSKKTVKPGRVVASRYSLIPINQSSGKLTATEARKRSLPESDKEEGNKRRASHGNRVSQKVANSCRAKKKWEIPSEVVVYTSDMVEDDSPSSVSVMADVLPKIKTNWRINDTPRDSGAAKRVADLVGKKPFFSVNKEDATGDSVFQALNFTEDDPGEE